MAESVVDYYDEHVYTKLVGLVLPNLRVEMAAEFIQQCVPGPPAAILEIGCGMGEISWRMARTWPNSRVLGVDISPKSIEFANRLFGSERIHYKTAELNPAEFGSNYDLIVMMDVFEHISAALRPSLYKVIRECLSPKGIVLLTFPTPRKLQYLRDHDPEGLQPVDMDITLDVLSTMAHETNTEVIYYREIGVWQSCDYGHCAMARGIEMIPVIHPNRGRKKMLADFIHETLKPSSTLSAEKPELMEKVLQEKLSNDEFARYESAKARIISGKKE